MQDEPTFAPIIDHRLCGSIASIKGDGRTKLAYKQFLDYLGSGRRLFPIRLAYHRHRVGPGRERSIADPKSCHPHWMVTPRMNVYSKRTLRRDSNLLDANARSPGPRPGGRKLT
jgi:hypothetical protein